MKNSFLFALALGILAACTDTAPIQVVPPLIAPPIPGLDIAKETFEIDADKGGTVAIKTGTSFKIPAQAFVDGQGQVVTGTVQVAYREFHDAVDVFLSGIPMNYDSAGISGALTTAGMFEIQASQQGKPLQMAKGKAVSMRMASYQPISEKHSFYTLDTASRSWAYKGEPTVEENTKRVWDTFHGLSLTWNP